MCAVPRLMPMLALLLLLPACSPASGRVPGGEGSVDELEASERGGGGFGSTGV